MWIRFGRRCSGKLRSFFSMAIAPESFLREVPRTGFREQLRLVVADADVSGANSSRRGHSNQCVVQLTEQGSATASKDDIELAQTGGISIRRSGSDRTTWPNLALQSPSNFSSALLCLSF
jgi:hypothetical protein